MTYRKCMDCGYRMISTQRPGQVCEACGSEYLEKGASARRDWLEENKELLDAIEKRGVEEARKLTWDSRS